MYKQILKAGKDLLLDTVFKKIRDVGPGATYLALMGARALLGKRRFLSPRYLGACCYHRLIK